MPSKCNFLNLAIEVGKFSKCKKAKVGCVIVDDLGRIVSTGYNGSPIKSECLCEDSEVTFETTLHAELNAILFAKRDLRNCTLFVTLSPCLRCAAAIVQSQISNVYYLFEYRDKQGIEFLRKHSVNCKQVISNQYKNLNFKTLKYVA